MAHEIAFRVVLVFHPAGEKRTRSARAQMEWRQNGTIRNCMFSLKLKLRFGPDAVYLDGGNKIENDSIRIRFSLSYCQINSDIEVKRIRTDFTATQNFTAN